MCLRTQWLILSVGGGALAAAVLRDAIQRTHTYLNEGGQKAKAAGVVRMWRTRQ